MKKQTLFLCLWALVLTGCKKKPAEQMETPEPTPQVTIVPDSTLWGHLGEDTGMSALQFITDQGDTMEIYRTSPYSGEDGKLVGEVRNYTDRFALTLCEDNGTLLTAINATQLAQHWQTAEGTIQLRTNGTIESQGLPYNGWKLWNGHLLFATEVRQEYGISTRIDTMDIITLDDDSLIVRNPINQTIAFSRKP